MSASVDQFGKALVSAGLMTKDEVQSLWTALPVGQRPKDDETFAKLLIDREKLTKFQAAELLSGSSLPLVLGDYVLLDKIGAGGMGQVFKARHRHMERLVAIKLLPQALTKDEDAVKRFQREVKAAAKLAHPNIVQAYDASVQRGVWYLVMEYVEGRDLAVLVKQNGPFPVQEAVDCILQAARGLAFAHSQGVIHRDIKPANLLRDKEGVVKILDMGLARIDTPGAAADHQLTSSGQVMGTMDYMAPEQAASTHDADARSDIYSLGCTLFRLLTGESIYPGETAVQKVLAHVGDPVPSLAQRRMGVPVELDAIFQKMVAKSPTDRFQTMLEVEQALTKCRTVINRIGNDATQTFAPNVAATFHRGAAGANTPNLADNATKSPKSPDDQNGVSIQVANVPRGRLATGRVETWCVDLAGAYLFPALSVAGASLARACQRSTFRSSNRTGGFPASGSRTRGARGEFASCFRPREVAGQGRQADQTEGFGQVLVGEP